MTSEMSARHISVAFREYAHLEKLRTANRTPKILTEGRAPSRSENAQDSQATKEKAKQAEEHDCHNGYSNWKMSWSVAKQEWCCEHHGRACWKTTTLAPKASAEAAQVQESADANVDVEISRDHSGLPEGQ